MELPNILPTMTYRIIRSDRKTLGLEVRAEELIIKVPRQTSDDEINMFILKHMDWIKKTHSRVVRRQKEIDVSQLLSSEEIQALAKKALQVFPERVKYFAPRIGVTYGRITIRNQRSRWESCSAKGNLNFNCLLMLAPPEVVDSVVVHELCHRKEMNHSKTFYEEVLRVLPDYWTWNKWLKENGDLLMKRMTG